MSHQVKQKKRLYDSLIWNVLLLSVGAFLIALSVKSVAAPHGFLTGGIMGLALLFEYLLGVFESTTWNLILNVPLLMFGLVMLGRTFVIYSIFGTVMITIMGFLIGDYIVPIQDPLYAAILSGVLFGFGNGIMLRTKGSSGGLDLVTVYIYRKCNIPMGTSAFMFNATLFCLSLFKISIDLVMISFIQIFMVKQVTNYVVTLFNQRKTVFIVTQKGQEICYAITAIGGYTTLIPAYAGASHDAKDVVISIATSSTIKSLEEIVYKEDPNAVFSVENTFYLSGGHYGR